MHTYIHIVYYVCIFDYCKYVTLPTGNSEQQHSDIGDAIKQMGSVMKQMGPMFSAISEKVQSQLEG